MRCSVIVGEYLYEKPKEIRREMLHRLARSSDLWERRIAIVSTMAFIRKQDLSDTFIIAEMLLTDQHDLIHKAVGWLIREAGKKDVGKLLGFLDLHAVNMPKTMLRYAIEKLTTTQQNMYMSKHNDARKGVSISTEGDSNVVKAEGKKKSTSTSAAVVKSATKSISKSKAAAKSNVVESIPSTSTGRSLRSKTTK